MCICIDKQKIRLFHWFVLEIWLIKNPAIWLAENILVHISGTKFFQNINFHYRTNSVKINFSINSKTHFLAHFYSIFPILGAKRIFFPENLALSRLTPNGFQAPCRNLEKTKDTVPRKCPDRQKDRQTLIYRTPPATAGVPKRHFGQFAIILRKTSWFV